MICGAAVGIGSDLLLGVDNNDAFLKNKRKSLIFRKIESNRQNVYYTLTDARCKIGAKLLLRRRCERHCCSRTRWYIALFFFKKKLTINRKSNIAFIDCCTGFATGS